MENKKDAFSVALQNLLLNNSEPILVIRGLAAALKLGLFLKLVHGMYVDML